jgi:hypothetical protein
MEDSIPGRRVWWNYWDTCICSEQNYYNRLKYVFWNPVKHGLAERPEEYVFGNYRDFLQAQNEFEFSGVDEVIDVPEF